MRLGRALGRSQQVLETVLRQSISKNTKDRVFRGYDPRPEDVFLTTLSKSGTNWLMQIGVQLAWHGQASFSHIHDLVAWPEAPFYGIAPLRDYSHAKRAPEGYRLIKTALEAEYVPIRRPAKYITLIRDPKSVFLSSYHFATRLFGMQGDISLDDWAARYTAPDFVGGCWATHTASYWALRREPHVLVLFYEDLARDLPSAVRTIADFLHVKLSDDAFEQVCHKASFSYMRAHEDAFGPPRFLFVPDGDRAEMVRSGRARAEIPAGIAEEIDGHMQAKLRLLGCEFPYARYYGPKVRGHVPELV